MSQCQSGTISTLTGLESNLDLRGDRDISHLNSTENVFLVDKYSVSKTLTVYYQKMISVDSCFTDMMKIIMAP
jgi:hypothetical protein